MEALDEPRGDDADHALVPAFVPEDVAPARATLRRPRLDPRDGLAQDPLLHGLALAYQGKKDQAVALGKKSLELMPISKDAANGAYDQHLMARIYLLVGEPEKALDMIEPLLAIPYFLSPGWLKIDPAFAPLKGNPRFEKLLAGS